MTQKISISVAIALGHLNDLSDGSLVLKQLIRSYKVIIPKRK